MNPIATANLRSGGRRLFAAGAAVAVAVAFVVAALLMVDSFSRTMRVQAQAETAGADLVVSLQDSADPAGDPVPDEALAQRLQDQPGVASAQAIRNAYAEGELGGQPAMLRLSEHPGHSTSPLVSGALPDAADEAVLTEDTARVYGIGPGDEIVVDAADPAVTGQVVAPETQQGDPGSVRYIVSGVVEGSSPYARAYLTPAGMDRLPVQAWPESIRIVLGGEAHGDPAAQAAVQQDIAAALAAATSQEVAAMGVQGTGIGEQLRVQTSEQIVEARMQDLTGQANVLAGVLAAFGAVALFVAALVIANTFQVLVASRTRTLALLRAIGAARRQLRSAMLLEGLVLGALGSIAGALLGYLAALGIGLAAGRFWQFELEPVTPTFAAFVAGPAVGVLMTVAACLLPAHRATTVTPMAALRPVDVEPVRRRVSWLRLSVGVLLTAGGFAATFLGGMRHEMLPAAGGAIAGFLGVLVLGRLFIPPMVRGLGLLLAGPGRFSRRGALPRLVAQNARQVPGRTTATTSALLIGVTLVSTMTIGAASAQASLEQELAQRLPLDMAVGVAGAGAGDVPGVLDGSGLVTAEILVPGTAEEARSGETEVPVTVLAPEPEAAETAQVMRRATALPDPGTALVAPATLQEGGEVELAGRVLDVEPAGWLPAGTVVLNPADATGLSFSEDAGQLWVRVSDDAGSGELGRLTAQLSEHTEVVAAEAALLRADYAPLIDTVLLVVLALLGSAVVVAVIGIGNTLSLSVFERRREAALLRAVGMSRGGVGGLITLEAVLMAAVALVLGLAAGAFFGWAGISSVFQADAVPVVLAVPWDRVAMIGVAALGAAVLASLLPARALSRTSPAAGLSVD